MRGARWLIFAVCVVAAFSGLAEPTGAHAVLERSAPADGAVLGSSPGVVAMVFDEPVGISLGSVMVYDARGLRVDKGGPYHPSGNGKAASENVPPDLPAGGYVVTWRVVSADSHPVPLLSRSAPLDPGPRFAAKRHRFSPEARAVG